MKENNSIPLVIGVGNEFRGDDAVGIEVVRELQQKYPMAAEYRIAEGDLSRLVNVWKGRKVFLVDAIYSGAAKPGSIYICETVQKLMTRQETLNSTHGIGVIEALQLSELLDKLPASFYFFGVEGAVWDFGSPLSAGVKGIKTGVVELIGLFIRSGIRFIHKRKPGGLYME